MAPRKPKPKPDAEPADDVDVTVEIDPEHEWRCRMLVQAGFSDFEAFRLSVNGADWHEAEVLLRKGATPDQIIRILCDI